MSVAIRLSQVGKKNAPTYRVVVTKTRAKRDGQAIEVLGNFNPLQKTVAINKERLAYWQGVGAIVSVAVDKLLNGKYEFVKYAPNKEKLDVRGEKLDKEVGSEKLEI